MLDRWHVFAVFALINPFGRESKRGGPQKVGTADDGGGACKTTFVSYLLFEGRRGCHNFVYDQRRSQSANE